MRLIFLAITTAAAALTAFTMADITGNAAFGLAGACLAVCACLFGLAAIGRGRDGR